MAEIVFKEKRRQKRANALVVKFLPQCNAAAEALEDGTYLRMSEVIREEVKDSPIVALSGPSHAEELGIGVLLLL